jgi:hypothetical protein
VNVLSPMPVVNITVSEAENLHVINHIQPVPQWLQLQNNAGFLRGVIILVLERGYTYTQ